MPARSETPAPEEWVIDAIDLIGQLGCAGIALLMPAENLFPPPDGARAAPTAGALG